MLNTPNLSNKPVGKDIIWWVLRLPRSGSACLPFDMVLQSSPSCCVHQPGPQCIIDHTQGYSSYYYIMTPSHPSVSPSMNSRKASCPRAQCHCSTIIQASSPSSGTIIIKDHYHQETRKIMVHHHERTNPPQDEAKHLILWWYESVGGGEESPHPPIFVPRDNFAGVFVSICPIRGGHPNQITFSHADSLLAMIIDKGSVDDRASRLTTQKSTRLEPHRSEQSKAGSGPVNAKTASVLPLKPCHMGYRTQILHLTFGDLTSTINIAFPTPPAPYEW